MRTALFVLVGALLGCGSAATSANSPKATPIVSAEPGAALPAMAEETEAERAASKGPVDKVAECNALIEVMNKGVEDLEAASKSDPNSATGVELYEAMADVMDQTRTKLAGLSLRDARLRSFSKDYQGMASNVSKSARALIRAAEAKDMAGVEKSKGEVEIAVKTEDPLVDAINKYCHGQ